MANTGSGLVATRYAKAFLDMAVEAKTLDKVEKDLREFAAMIEASADLQTWSPLQTLPAGSGGTITFRALQPDTLPRLFLRARRE